MTSDIQPSRPANAYPEGYAAPREYDLDIYEALD